MISDITGICMVSLQNGFPCVFSDYCLEKMISGITGICMAFLQYGLSCVHSAYYYEQMIYSITDICMASLQYGFSCVFSDNHSEEMTSDITGICMAWFSKYMAPLTFLTKMFSILFNLRISSSFPLMSYLQVQHYYACLICHIKFL